MIKMCVPGPVLVIFHAFSFFLYCTDIYLQLNRIRVRATTTTTTASLTPKDDKIGSSRASADVIISFFLFHPFFYCSLVLMFIYI